MLGKFIMARNNQLLRNQYASWDRDYAEYGVHTRMKGDIPGCTPEAKPLNKDQELMDKYSLSPNDPQWVFEMCTRIAAR